MKHLVSRELYAYWDRLRGTRAAPERSDLDPAAIRSILADTFLMELPDGRSGEDREATIRLSGTRLNALWCGDIKGQSLVSFWCPQDRSATRNLIDLVLDDQVPVVAGALALIAGAETAELEMLLLPLRHHGKTHTRLLGSIVPQAPPVWLGLHPVTELRLTSFRSIVPPARPLWRGSLSKTVSSLPVRHGRFTVHQGGRQAAGNVRTSFDRANRL